MKDGFFKWSDRYFEKLGNVVLDPGFYWSRRYEYPFALMTLDKEDIILDAACGTYHPFKTVAGKISKVYACDLEDAEPSEDYIFTRADITDLPYKTNMFTKVFCLSVIEHLGIDKINVALKEFHRVLKPYGKLILTVDYPSVDIPSLYTKLREAGFKTGEANMNMDEAITSKYFGPELYCYHIIAEVA